jgi:hypothetical protein
VNKRNTIYVLVKVRASECEQNRAKKAMYECIQIDGESQLTSIIGMTVSLDGLIA